MRERRCRGCWALPCLNLSICKPEAMAPLRPTPKPRPRTRVPRVRASSTGAPRRSGPAQPFRGTRTLSHSQVEQARELLADQTIMIVPSANPDGRARNSRGNSRGTDINRDHLTLATEEARAFASS